MTSRNPHSVFMLFLLAAGATTLFTAAILPHAPATEERATKPVAHLVAHFGFDRNDYPGDSNLSILRRSFVYSGYWLNSPPGTPRTKASSWLGKRRLIEAAGFGFLVIFNGRTFAEIKSGGDASKLGASDAAAAIAAASSEGFPLQTVIFLDQEQGGRLLAEQRVYLLAWVDGITSAHFQAGVYCSGIPFREGSGATIITAEDIRNHAGDRKIKYWVIDDSCPPSPGCTRSKVDLTPESSGISFADVWQFAQSPRRNDFARECSAGDHSDSYNRDRNCYFSDAENAERIHVDLDVSNSADPSHGRTRQ
jgi:Domain of unknown function (DUF1906)